MLILISLIVATTVWSSEQLDIPLSKDTKIVPKVEREDEDKIDYGIASEKDKKVSLSVQIDL